MKSPQRIVVFLKNTFQNQGKTKGIIAVSGGIDSALSLTLLTQALGPKNVFPLFLPYGDQSIEDSQFIAKWNKIPVKNWETINIKPAVDLLSQSLHVKLKDKVRLGNIMARVRMISVYDRAKSLDALVCGTENKSEHYLGYFTRFGDSASDIEPICHLYKTDVRELARQAMLPEIFLTKAPSAGLWQDQTDEAEIGFSYEEADKALKVILGESSEPIEESILNKVKKIVEAQAFKLHVPYGLHSR